MVYCEVRFAACRSGILAKNAMARNTATVGLKPDCFIAQFKQKVSRIKCFLLSCDFPRVILACYLHVCEEDEENMNRLGLSGYFSIFFFLISGLRALVAQSATDTNTLWLAEHYTKYEHRISMR